MTVKTRILFDNLFVARGGAEVFMMNVINFLPKDQYDITVAAVYWDKNDPNEKLPPGVHFIKRYHRRKHYKKGTPLWFLDVAYGRVYDALLNAYLSLLNFDIAIATQEKQTMRRTSQIRAKRKFAWIHTDYSTRLDHNVSKSFPHPGDELACMKQFEKVVCVSKTAMDSVIASIGDPGNLCVRYNPIDVRRIRELSGLPCPLQKEADRPLLVSVGRLVAEKHYITLLEACKLLKDTLPFDVWIIGDGEERPMLQEYIDREGLGNVKLLGTQTNPFHYLIQADLFVSASVTEGYGLAVQEALVLGVPVAAVNCPGVAESLDLRFGALTEDSPEALAAEIKRMTEPQTLMAYKRRVADEYPANELFEKRLEAICGLWEKDAVQA